MPKTCIRSDCKQRNPQHSSQFRKSTLPGHKVKVCVNCEAEHKQPSQLKPKPMKHITIEQHRENERLRADNAAS